MIPILKGNLIDLAESGCFDIIVHGCNCFHAMGAGIAKEIADRYFDAYKADCKSPLGDYDKLGNYTIYRGTHFDIVNAYTQYFYSRGEGDVFEYSALDIVLAKLAHRFPQGNFGLPWIGCGLAGGDKDLVLDILSGFHGRITSTGGNATLVELP